MPSAGGSTKAMSLPPAPAAGGQQVVVPLQGLAQAPRGVSDLTREPRLSRWLQSLVDDDRAEAADRKHARWR